MDRPISAFNKAIISDAYEQERRTHEAITSTDWNNLFNQHRYQGNHSENYLEELDHYLFGHAPQDDEPIPGALLEALEHIESVQAELDAHKDDLDNPHQVIALQVNASAIAGVTGGQVQEILENLKTQIDAKIATSTASDLYETKADAALHIVGVTVNESTGVFTFTRNNGSTFSIDTAIEKIATNWYFNQSTQKLELTLKDGTVQEVDLSAFIKPNEFINSDDIVWSVNGQNVSCNITNTYKNTMNSLKSAAEDAAIRAEVAATSATNQATNASSYATAAGLSSDAANTAKTAAQGYRDSAELYKNSAGTSASASADSATLAESYAKGGTGSRSGEATDNAKYYMERAAYWAGQASEGQLQADWNQTDTTANDYIRNKPTIPVVDQTYDSTSTNAISSKGLKSILEGLDASVGTVANDLGNVSTLTTTSKVAAGAINELNSIKGTVKFATMATKAAVSATLQEGEFMLVTDEPSGSSLAVIDALTSVSTIDALSANQGRILKNSIDNLSTPNEISVSTSAWESDSTSTDYPYKAVYETTDYSDDFIPQYVDMIPSNGTPFFSEGEDAAKGVLNPNVSFSSTAVTFYAATIPTVSLTFRIGGVA